MTLQVLCIQLSPSSCLSSHEQAKLQAQLNMALQVPCFQLSPNSYILYTIQEAHAPGAPQHDSSGLMSSTM
jgi:hypothetical protein